MDIDSRSMLVLANSWDPVYWQNSRHTPPLDCPPKTRQKYSMLKKYLDLVALSGSHQKAGTQYGKLFSVPLAGFLSQEVPPNPERIKYAQACWQKTLSHAPASAAFMKGIHQGSNLSQEEVTLLALHEELNHQTHCTAFAATGSATRSGKALIAQNWDWKTWRYPWPGLLRLNIKGAPRLLTYHYPGLWASLGINQHGLSLMWTGGGYFPQVKPIVGVPTYALIYDLLQRKNLGEALDYLENTPHAGCFLFFLGDGQGNIAVVEGVPGKIIIDRSGERLTRANHFECAELVAASKQDIPKTANTEVRGKLAEKFLKQTKKNTLASMKKHLTRNPEIHRFSTQHMTIDSFVADCQKKILYVSRGGLKPGPWKAYEV